MADNSEIESAPTLSIKSLKSRFEQLAQENAVSLVSPSMSQSSNQTLLTPDPPTHRTRASVGGDERPSQSEARALRTSISASDMKKVTRRAPPPPPPSRGRKPSPAVSPLLRPVPIPATRPGQTPQASQDSDVGDDLPLQGTVASLRSRLSSSAAVVASSPPRPTTPKPLPRPAGSTSHNDSSVHEFTPSLVPVRHTMSDRSPSVSSVTLESPDDTLELGLVMNASTRTGSVASLRDRFTAMSIPTSATPKPLVREDRQAWHSEPNILAPTNPPPTLLTRRPPPPPPTGPTLFQTEDDSQSACISSHSPFSDDESILSEITPPLKLPPPPAIPPRKTNSSPRASNGASDHARKLSDVSSSSDGFPPSPKPKPPPRPGARLPPRTNGIPHGAPVASSPISLLPPPLPSRRVTPDEVPDIQSFAPPLPARSAHAAPSGNVADPACERKLLGNNKLLPPPTRQIGLGDKLPPVRRPPTPSSDEESGEDDDPRDSSRSSRRPPSLSCFVYPASRIQVPAHSGQVAIALPSAVIATHHHIKYYDLSCSDVPLWTIDTREAGLREAKVTCLEFKPTAAEGHLFEVDVGVGSVTATKFGVHACQVTHMFRYGRMMVTVDDAGKMMVFDPDSDVGMAAGMGEEDVSLVYTQPRVYRTAEKQDFVKMLGGLLWTSVRTEMNGTGTASVPVIRIYDPFVPGSVARCVMPTQRVGAVIVYLGHEGGFISVWNIDTPGGTPECVEVMKVSASDVLCLEGVNDRLWAGGRKGTVSAYDVSPRPWVVTNCWEAHDGLPVLKLFVDPSAIERVGRLCVASVGRDERMRFWDGLLGSDWVGQELLKREHAFSKFRNLNVLIVSWNSTDAENAQFFQKVFQSSDGPDIIAFGFQEVIDLESRKMAAKTVLLGGKKKGEDGKISEKVSSSYKRWHDRLVMAVKMAMPPDSPYTVIHTESLVGLFTCIFVKNAQRASVKDVAITTIKRGMGGRYGNKGAIVARLVVDNSSICFINCHLAAGQGHVRQRNADVAAVLEEKSLFPPSDAVEEYIDFVGGGDGSMVLDHEIVFLNGDMNYRIDQRRETSGELELLFPHDQLLREMKHNQGFRLRAFQEGPLMFAPTYKYDRRSNEFDTSEKRRTPAWCDLQLNYQRYEANVSDHRPISAAFKVTIKSVRQDVRAREKMEVGKRWTEMEMELLESAREFYVQQARTLI
ncbi:hypothetical protein F5J12DRAFT_853067 [Pisolithus orientalis]|uniref:uncharacterized protein n=1 Tax=Pisolithus orientalis TaxID=936130 RepID=UPI002224F256|nr:uncharacterized protein F5J12DRAFT_853067 [Pisolithus orientalis]KAI5996569.1 hypothetical protein F5J12DRAFT_853067 [Pisolithus orientalis]